MQFRLELDLSEQEIKDAFKPRLDATMAAVSGELAQRGRQLASERLNSGLKLWEKGFKVEKVEDGFFVIAIEGKLAKMIEDGAKAGEISDMILNGNRAKANRSGYRDPNSGQQTRKNYVDVPIGNDAQVMSGSKGISVKSFADADSLRKFVTFSDYKKGGVKHEQRVLKRVEDIIESTNPSSGATSYLTIRRVGEDTKWPASPTQGARVLDQLENELEAVFDDLAARYI